MILKKPTEILKDELRYLEDQARRSQMYHIPITQAEQSTLYDYINMYKRTINLLNQHLVYGKTN